MSNENQTTLEEITEELLQKEGVYNLVFVNSGTVVKSLEIKTALKNPYEFDVSRFLPNTVPMSLGGFFDLTSTIISNSQTKSGIATENQVKLTEEYPPEEFHNFGQEVIVYRVISREPARMNRTGTGRPQRKASYHYDLQAPQYPNKSIVVENRPVDHIIEFSCWAKTNRLANSRAIWLEKLLINNSWRYETKGIEKFYWEGRGPDTYMTSGEQRLFYRPLRFFVRFREFEVKLHSLIKDIQIIYGG